MKKFVTLALALVMALSLAAPALAFTGLEYQAPAATEDVKLSIRLVDVSNGFLGSSFTAPATNRGYAQNQVVCAIVDMVVAKGKKADDKYDTLVFSGKNVSLWQDENFRGTNFGDGTAAFDSPATDSGGGIGILRYTSDNVVAAINEALKTDTLTKYKPFSYAANMSVDNSITLQLTTVSDDSGAAGAGTSIFTAPNYEQTYQFAIFGRVLADDGAISATLKGGGALLNASDTNQSLDNPSYAATGFFNLVSVKSGAYMAGYFNPNIEKLDADNTNKLTTSTNIGATANTAVIGVTGTEIVYMVTDAPSGAQSTAKPIFAIVTDKNFKTKAMYVFGTNGTPVYRVQAVTDASFPNAAKASFWDDTLVQFLDKDGAVLTVPTTISYLLNDVLGAIVDDVFGLDIRLVGGYMPESWWAGNAELSAEVKVEPWYAEVTVPPEIEIEIPKTGDALSVMGFVLIALAGLAVVAVRKVRA